MVVVSVMAAAAMLAAPMVPGMAPGGEKARAARLDVEQDALAAVTEATSTPGTTLEPAPAGTDPTATTTEPSSTTTTGPQPTDKLFAHVESGIVRGTLTANAGYSVDVVNGGVVKASAAGKTAADGTYTAPVAWHDGVGEGLHRGDTVRVVDKAAARTYSQPIGLAGALEEHTGRFVAIALPNAEVKATLYKVFAHGKVVAEKTVKADATGRVFIDWSTVHAAPAQPDRPAWRGYDVDVVSRTAAGQAQHRELSTASPTLANTLNQGGGGNFVPGDNVTFELWRNGGLRDAKSTVVNGDGVPRAIFAVDVGQGDMMRTKYHESTGTERAIDMAPWTLTADVNLEAKTISGMAAPNVPVGGIVRNPGGPTITKTVAGSDGRYTLQFASMVADSQVSLWRVADTGNTGVAVQQQLMHTPVIRVDDVLAEVSGNGAHGVNNAVIDVLRNGVKVFSKTVTTTKAGKFRGELKTEIAPGDTVQVTTGVKAIGPFSIGAARFTTYGLGDGRLGGTGVPGRRVTAGRTGCLATAIVSSAGTWEATPAGCTLGASDLVLVAEEETAGPTIGSTRGHYQWVTSPDVVLTAPALGSRAAAATTFTAEAFDKDDGRNPSSVRFYVDGKLVAVDTTAPYSHSMVLTAGAHTVVAEAVDAASRRDASGKEIVARTATRYFRV